MSTSIEALQEALLKDIDEFFDLAWNAQAAARGIALLAEHWDAATVQSQRTEALRFVREFQKLAPEDAVLVWEASIEDGKPTTGLIELSNLDTSSSAEACARLVEAGHVPWRVGSTLEALVRAHRSHEAVVDATLHDGIEPGLLGSFCRRTGCRLAAAILARVDPGGESFHADGPGGGPGLQALVETAVQTRSDHWIRIALERLTAAPGPDKWWAYTSMVGWRLGLAADLHAVAPTHVRNWLEARVAEVVKEARQTGQNGWAPCNSALETGLREGYLSDPGFLRLLSETIIAANPDFWMLWRTIEQCLVLSAGPDDPVCLSERALEIVRGRPKADAQDTTGVWPALFGPDLPDDKRLASWALSNADLAAYRLYALAIRKEQAALREAVRMLLDGRRRHAKIADAWAGIALPQHALDATRRAFEDILVERAVSGLGRTDELPMLVELGLNYSARTLRQRGSEMGEGGEGLRQAAREIDKRLRTGRSNPGSLGERLRAVIRKAGAQESE